MSLSNLLSHKGDIMIKTSISHNYRFPTLNDLYFYPVGTPVWKTSTVSVMMRAWVSMSTRRTSTNWMAVPRGSIPKSRIGSSGYRQPRAFSHHETWKGTCLWCRGKSQSCRTAGKNWLIDLSGSYSWTPSINEGEKMSPADQSVRKQLPYVPKYSPSLTGRLSWGTWAFLYKWAFYSECFTMSSNDYTLTGDLPRYFMSNILFEKKLLLKPMDVQLKFAQ